MKRCHNLVHYRLSSTLMIVGIAVSFICFFNCVNLYHLLATEKKEKREYQYNSHMSANYLNMGENVMLGELLTSDKGIIRLQGILLYRNQLEVPGLTDILMCQNEPLNYPVLGGKLPETDREVTVPTVILGRKQIADAVFENGEYYYELEGVKCKVCAILGSENSELFDYNMILYYKGMEEELNSVIDKADTIEIMIESNQTEAQTIFEMISQQVREKTEQVMLGAGSSVIVMDEQRVSGDSTYYLVIFLFCFVNIIIVSEYWIKRRYGEIAVRKIFGYSNRKIYALLYRDMIINVSIAVLIAIAVQAGLQCAFGEYLTIYESQFGFYLLYSVMFIFLLSALIMIYPFWLLQKEDELRQMIAKCR